jgi:hypothetical protein
MAALALTAATIDGDDQPPVGGVAVRVLRGAQQLLQADPCATGWVIAAGFGRRRRPPAGVGVLSDEVPVDGDGWTVVPGCEKQGVSDVEARCARAGDGPGPDLRGRGHCWQGVVLAVAA